MSSLEYSVTIVYENTSFYYDLLEMFEFVEKQSLNCLHKIQQELKQEIYS